MVFFVSSTSDFWQYSVANSKLVLAKKKILIEWRPDLILIFKPAVLY
jgi:hypothetical protein